MNRSKKTLVFVLGLFLITGVLWLGTESKAQRRSSGRAAREATKRTLKGVENKLDELVTKLESGSKASELEQYFQAETKIGKEYLEQLSSDPDASKRLASILKKFQGASITLSSDKLTASSVAEFSKQESKAFQRPRKENVAQSVSSAGFVGYGNDLKAALQKGEQDLKNGDLKKFIRHFYPEAEIQQLLAQKKEDHLLARFKKYPVLVEELTQDFEQLQKLDGKRISEEGRNVLSFQIPGDKTWKKRLVSTSTHFRNIPEQPAREIRFELVDGNWRFYDGNKKSREAMKRERYGLPVGGGAILTWERTEKGWRLAEIPFF